MAFDNENILGQQDTLVSWGNKQINDPKANPLNRLKGMIVNMLALKHGLYRYLPAYPSDQPFGRTMVPIMTSLPTADAHRLFMDLKPTSGGFQSFTEGSNGYSTHIMYQQDLLEGDYASTSAMKQMANTESAAMVLGDRAARDVFYSNPKSSVLSTDAGSQLDQTSNVKGLYSRYNTTDTDSRISKSVHSFGGSTLNKQTSIWLVARGRQDVHLQFPLGHKGKGLTRKHFANQLLPTIANTTSGKVEGYNVSTHDVFYLASGIVVRKWVCVIRGANIDAPKLAAGTLGATALGVGMSDMITALERVESVAASSQLGTDVARTSDAAFFCNNTVRGAIFKEIYKNQVGGGFTVADATMEKRNMMMMFGGLPIYKDDGILNTEAVVA